MFKIGSKSLADTLAVRLTKGALPGELDGFGKAELAAAAAFVADAASQRKAGKPSVAIESVTDDDGQRRMRLAIVNDDMPFLVDSIAAAIAAHDIAIDRIIHPVLKISRDKAGKLTSCDDGSPESMIYLELERVDARARTALVESIEQVLAAVRAATGDWPRLQDALEADIATVTDDEGAALLRWFLDGHLTLLGHETWSPATGSKDATGIAKLKTDQPLLAETSRQIALDWFQNGGATPLLIKSNLISPVHRAVPLDLVIVPVRAGHSVTGLSIHAGLWTSAALATPPAEVPVLRQRLIALQDKFGFDRRGHTGKALAHALTQLPHDLATSFAPDDLEHLALTAMSLADRPRPKLVLVRSALGRHLFAFVWLPRDDVTTDRRLAVGDMLSEAAAAPLLSWSIALEDGVVALIRYTFDLREGGTLPDAGPLDVRLARMVRGWAPAVEAALIEHVEPARAARLALSHASDFPLSYRTQNTPEEAANDILRLARLESADDRQVRLYHPPHAADARLKIYRLGGALALSDAVPVLENFGFRVVEEVPTPLADEKGGYVHDFAVETASDYDDHPTMLEDAIQAVLEGAAENDAFNRLIVDLDMPPSSVVLFRAWFRYLRQAGLSYGLSTVVDALRRAPEVAGALIRRFEAVHGPDANQKTADAADAAITAALNKVAAIDDDRILRAYWGVIRACLRTNFYAPAAAEALAFKLDSAQVPGLPAPLPWREIWVYSPRVEGIHLRAGPVARGGLRWSDRRDDFRTEILGLMKAQRVKNAVIVPTGAKGGFYPKQLPSPAVDRDAWFSEGTESYRIFIRTLLSVTDNIVNGQVVHPEGVRTPDGDDPYFVVAADKGTATFSDVANEIALDRGFWLGDAFASGGSVGYDHKAMGITAKGAWISVQRHFLEQGVDVQTQPIRVVGCGDMSGDVFGNGMLLSKAIKLIAAFDHRHIFIDPDPDPAASWDERDRMFALPRSSWADYNPKLISKGGGIYSRAEKSITVSEEAMRALDLPGRTMEPADLISAILRSTADLIWFGGIGTYVKAAGENNATVGDAANDRLRVDAEELRAKAIGEGANLGVTQAARIAFAKLGGRINTDFIDNSAGVDCSDNEVNIKIALNREMNEGRLPYAKRNTLLRSMTDQVSELVLDDNRYQTLAISVAELNSKTALGSYVRRLDQFEATGRVDRKVEGLPPNEELLRRDAEGLGLTRPELAVLLSTAKLTLQDAMEDMKLGLDPFMDETLEAAFPAKMRKPYRKAILDHQLRNEIVATKVANRMVNRLGIVHPFELAEEEGATLAESASAFLTVERLFDLEKLFDEFDNAPMAEGARLRLLDQVAGLTRSHMADLLRSGEADKPIAAAVADLGPGLAKLAKSTDKLMSDVGLAAANAIAQEAIALGVSAPIAAKLRHLYIMDGVIGIVSLANRRNIDPFMVARAFIDLNIALGLNWAQTQALRLVATDPWERLLVSGLARDFQQMKLDFLEGVGKGDPVAYVEKWLASQAPRVAQFRSLVDGARATPAITAAMLAQIAGQARALLGR